MHSNSNQHVEKVDNHRVHFVEYGICQDRIGQSG